MNSLRAGRVALGQFKAWVVGIHTGLSGTNSHEGLLQVEPVPVCRDRNKDFKRNGDFVDQHTDGFDQHHGLDQPADNIGRAGAGCLVGRAKAGHQQLIALVKSDARFAESHGYRFMTTLLEAADVQ